MIRSNGRNPEDILYRKLAGILSGYREVIVAFSGGADSALVAKTALDVLGAARMLAVTADSASLPERERRAVQTFVNRYEIPHRWIQTAELREKNYADNPVNRCFFCKTELYRQLNEILIERPQAMLCNGTNTEDLGDWRPGLKAARDFKVKSPLVEAGFGKLEIRRLSRYLGLPTAEKPASACLSSRVAYGQAISEDLLARIDAGEDAVRDCGFRIVRLRYLGSHVRVEVGEDETARLIADEAARGKIRKDLERLGFSEIKWDDQGYRQGRLNEEAHLPL